jgi:hypothetical protein
MFKTFRCSALAPMLMTVWATAALAQEGQFLLPMVQLIEDAELAALAEVSPGA